MMEVKRLLYSKKSMILLLLLILFSIFLVFYEYQDRGKWEEEMSDMQAKEQVQDIIDECDQYAGISIFADANSFSYKNVQKTKTDYSKILDVKTTETEVTFLDFLISYKTINYFLLGMGILIVPRYVEPRDQGLKVMTHATKYGRGRRCLRQIMALFVWSGVPVLLVYGGSILTWLVLTGGSGGRLLMLPLQNLALCRLVPMKICVLQYMFLFFAVKWLVLFGILLCIWFLYLIIENVIIAAGMGILLFVVEGLVDRLIGLHSSYNIVKFCNLWYHAFSNEYLYRYLNLNLFGRPVGRLEVMIVVCLAGIILLTALSYWKGEHSKADALWFSVSLTIPFVSYIQERLNRLTAELYKLLVMQKGLLLVLFFAAFVVNQSDFTQFTHSGYQDLYYAFMEQYEGLPSEESEQYIQKLSTEINAVEEEYRKAEEAYEQARISDEEYLTVLFKYDSFENERKFLAIIEKQQEHLKQLKEEKGIEGWYVNAYCYQSLIEPVVSLKYGLLIVLILLMAYATVRVETDAGMPLVIGGTVYGREDLTRSKVAAVSIVSFLMYVVMVAVKIGSVCYLYGISGVHAPAQSLEPFSGFPFSISLLGLMILYYGMILVVSLLIAAGATKGLQRYRHVT